MHITDFTVEEINLIDIYITESKTKTIYRIHDAFPYMDEDMQQIAVSSARKLSDMTDAEFSLSMFIPAE